MPGSLAGLRAPVRIFAHWYAGAVKLCRFELTASPGETRSGLFYDGRVYETDGESAIGIHDPSSIRLQCPIGRPSAVRFFDLLTGEFGEPLLTYSYLHPSSLVRPLGEIPLSESSGPVGLDVRVCAVVQEEGRLVERAEAERHILGYSILANVVDLDGFEKAQRSGRGLTPARDQGSFFGPFVVTPDELTEAMSGDDRTRFTWTLKIAINRQTIFESTQAQAVSAADVLAAGSVFRPWEPGEIAAFPALEVPDLSETPLGRPLAPTDHLAVTVEPLGTLVGEIA
ncbi:MAG: fumarylacetoacetate hydrolase family protein [Fimbriimonadaceae bacterium]|nr:fumarylacetoacetate hydrolase family protein [Fimbriimonadaceae bacterium]QYK59475.1 MAG: fumarylacetoacetate hydrolase family protein [Fimbriimonadaceae bacterium]